MNTMDDMLRQLERCGSAVGLSADERAVMRARLSELTRTMPVRNSDGTRCDRVKEAPRAARGWFRAPIRSLRAMPVAGIALAVVLSGGGVAFAAEQALPGDALYPVKVGVNEEVRAVLAMSDEAKAEWEAERATRRLDEAARLSARGELDQEALAAVESGFRTHADKVRTRIAAFEQRGEAAAAAKVSSAFEGSLRAHERILARLAEDDRDAEAGSLAAAVEDETDAAAETRSRSEGHVKDGDREGVRTAAEGRLGAAMQKIEQVRGLIAKWQERLGEGATAEAVARLTAAESEVGSGQELLGDGEYAEAFARFQSAHRIAQESVVLLNARIRLDVNVGIGLDRTRGGDDDDTDEEEDVSEEDDRDDADSDEDGRRGTDGREDDEDVRHEDDGGDDAGSDQDKEDGPDGNESSEGAWGRSRSWRDGDGGFRMRTGSAL